MSINRAPTRIRNARALVDLICFIAPDDAREVRKEVGKVRHHRRACRTGCRRAKIVDMPVNLIKDPRGAESQLYATLLRSAAKYRWIIDGAAPTPLVRRDGKEIALTSEELTLFRRLVGSPNTEVGESEVRMILDAASDRSALKRFSDARRKVEPALGNKRVTRASRTLLHALKDDARVYFFQPQEAHAYALVEPGGVARSPVSGEHGSSVVSPDSVVAKFHEAFLGPPLHLDFHQASALTDQIRIRVLDYATYLKQIRVHVAVENSSNGQEIVVGFDLRVGGEVTRALKPPVGRSSRRRRTANALPVGGFALAANQLVRGWLWFPRPVRDGVAVVVARLLGDLPDPAPR